MFFSFLNLDRYFSTNNHVIFMPFNVYINHAKCEQFLIKKYFMDFQPKLH